MRELLQISIRREIFFYLGRNKLIVLNVFFFFFNLQDLCRVGNVNTLSKSAAEHINAN